MTLWCLDRTTWRAECVRLCLFSAGIPFDDRRIDYGELSGSGRLRFGTFPVLEVNGRVLAQSHAIATYVGKLSGFYPVDPWLGAKVDEVMAALADVTDLIATTMQEQDPVKRVRWRQRLLSEDGRLLQLLAGLEDVLVDNAQNCLCAGNELSVADFAVWRAVGWISGGVEGIPPDLISRSFPHLWALHSSVDTLVCVREWKKLHPYHYGPP